jgi:hypothetical protein
MRAGVSQRVEAVISELGLESCADTVVGNVFVKGVSGGTPRGKAYFRIAAAAAVVTVFADAGLGSGIQGRSGAARLGWR